MVGELGPWAAPRASRLGVLAQRLGVGPVERPSLAGQEIVVGRLLDKRMTEREPGCLAVAVLDEQMAVDGGAEALGHLVLGQADDLGEQLVVDPPAGDRGHAEHALRAVGRGRDPRGQRRRTVGGRPETAARHRP